MTQERQPQKESLLPNLVSVLPPLVQLIAVVAVGLSDLFKFSSFFFKPELFTLINLSVIFIIISCIGFLNWRSNRLILQRSQENLVDPQLKNYGLLKFLLIFQIVAFLLLLSSVIIKITEESIKLPPPLLPYLQYVSYVIFLSVSGIIIYIWLSDFVKRRQAYQREDFIPNLFESLRNQGYISEPGVKITKNQFLQNYSSRYVEIMIKNKKYHLTVSLDGLEIYEIYNEDEFKKLNQSTNVVETEEKK